MPQSLNTCRNFKGKRREYMKTKVTRSRKTVRTKIFGKCNKGINEFKNGCQPRAYVINKDDGTIMAETASILSR